MRKSFCLLLWNHELRIIVSDYLGYLHLRAYRHPSQKRMHEHKVKQRKLTGHFWSDRNSNVRTEIEWLWEERVIEDGLMLRSRFGSATWLCEARCDFRNEITHCRETIKEKADPVGLTSGRERTVRGASLTPIQSTIVNSNESFFQALWSAKLNFFFTGLDHRIFSDTISEYTVFPWNKNVC
jgi:hypothetical protein